MTPDATEPRDVLDTLHKTPDFSLVLGGPLYQLLRRAHLTDDALTMVRRRIVVITLLVWLPLLVLSMLEGHALEGIAVDRCTQIVKRADPAVARCRGITPGCANAHAHDAHRSIRQPGQVGDGIYGCRDQIWEPLGPHDAVDQEEFGLARPIETESG